MLKLSNTEVASGMVSVTDKSITKWSNGEVINVEALIDPKIFGNFENEEMGHIQFDQPYVNIQYLCGRRPILSSLIGFDRETTYDIAHYKRFINLNQSSEDYRKVLKYDEYRNVADKGDYKTGAIAIESLLKLIHTSFAEYIILKKIPVLPLNLRYYENPKGEIMPLSINYLYQRVLIRKERLNHLVKLGAPDIILLNEARILQEYIDRLINNGVYGFPFLMNGGFPAESMQECHDYITGNMKHQKYEVPKDYQLNEEAPSIIKEYRDFIVKEEKPEEGYEEKRMEIVDRFMQCMRPFDNLFIKTYFPDAPQDCLLNVADYMMEHCLMHLDLSIPLEEQMVDQLGKTICMYLKRFT